MEGIRTIVDDATVWRFDVPIPQQCITCLHYIRPFIEAMPGYPGYNAGVLCGKTGFRTTKDNDGLHIAELLGCGRKELKE